MSLVFKSVPHTYRGTGIVIKESLSWNDALWTFSVHSVSFSHFNAGHIHNKYSVMYLCTEEMEKESLHVYISVSVRHLLYCIPHSSGCIALALHLCPRPESEPLCITHSNYLLSEAPRWTKRQRLKKHHRPSRSFVALPSPLIEKQREAWVIYTQDTRVPPGINSQCFASLNIVCILLLKKERGCEYFDSSTGDK